MPVFDLKRDSIALLRGQWLEEGESVVAWTPVWRLPRLDGIPAPGIPVEHALRVTARVLAKAPLYAILGVFVLWALGEAGGGNASAGGGSAAKGPAVVIRGQGRDSLTGRLVTPALRARGLWVLTDRRLAFVAIRGWVYSKTFSNDPETGDEERRLPPVAHDTVFYARSRAYRYEGLLKRTRRTRLTRREKPAGRYHIVTFTDGSTVELRARGRSARR